MSKVQNLDEIIDRFGPHLHDAPADGWLLVTDRWAPGWKASVNDRPPPVFGGDFIFRAVPVQRGTNHVLMRYQPRTVPWLLIVCWGTMGGVAIASALRRWRHAPRLLAAAIRALRSRRERAAPPSNGE